jgi:hypothetical protein
VRATIGQECDARLTLASEILRSPPYDADLILLDDAVLVHAAVGEIGAITRKKTG